MENGLNVSVARGRLHESVDSVARRFARMLQDLSAIHPALADWKKLGGPRRKPPRPFCAMPPDIDELVRIFTEGRYFTDTGLEQMPNLGYTAVAWNGYNNVLGCFLEIEAGVLNIGSPRSNSAELLSAATLESVFRVVIAAWEPVWGTVGNMNLRAVLRGAADERHRYTGGWMVYLGASFDDHVATRPDIVVRRPPQGGRLLIATEEPFSLADPEHMKAARAIQKSFAAINVNDPLPWEPPAPPFRFQGGKK